MLTDSKPLPIVAGMSRELTLVHIPPNKSPFWKVVASCKAKLAEADLLLRTIDDDAIHSTIIGIESVPGDPSSNRNWWNAREQRIPMDFGMFLSVARGIEAFQVRLGGWQADERPFRTRSRPSPYEATAFAGKGPFHIALAAWSVGKRPDGTESYPATLAKLRMLFARAGILHKFEQPDDSWYFKIAWAEDLESAEVGAAILREFLAAEEPVVLPVRPEDLHVVAYQDPDDLADLLNKGTAIPMADRHLTAEWMRRRGEASLWLVPSMASRETLQQMIRGVSAKHGRPSFLPHVTLLGGITWSRAREIALAKQALVTKPLTINVTGVDHSSDYFRCAFLEVDRDPALERLRADLGTALGIDESPWRPHMSVVYGDLPEQERNTICTTLQFPPSIDFDELRVVAPPERGWQDVENWQTLRLDRIV